jgi:S1-C subfamily serine protease
VPCPHRPLPNWPAAPAVPGSVRAVLSAEPLRLAADAKTRRVEKLTLRIRNISCGHGAIGSCFALNAHTLITNRHVIAGAAALQADPWDGQTVDLEVSQAATGRLVDIGVIHIAQALPVVATGGPEPAVGASVTAVVIRSVGRSPSPTARCSPTSTARRLIPRSSSTDK